jgi:hypothetical protein
MNTCFHNFSAQRASQERGSVLIIVLWISIGLIAITLYFADSMTLEYRASDNRAAGLAAEQAVEGVARYVSWALYNYGTNGAMPTNIYFTQADIKVGDSRAWLIGRDPNGNETTDPAFGLVDEASKLNLNIVTTNALAYLPFMDYELAEYIVDWRMSNATYSPNYASFGYEGKHAPYESADELRLVYDMQLRDLIGDDLNRNGVLDGSEKSETLDKRSSPGLLEYTTAYTREPNANSEGSLKTNVNNEAQLASLLTSVLGGRSEQIVDQWFDLGQANRRSLLAFYISSGLNQQDFERIYDHITTSTNLYIEGRVNINTASEPVLTALFMATGAAEQLAQGAAETMISYRRQNPNNLGTIAWMVNALGQNHSIINALRSRDWITTRSYQFSADIAAVGPHGRGYRRVRYVFDTTEGTPRILQRQDLSGLGWALGETVRTKLLAENSQ